METLQMRQEIKLQGHIARTDPDLAGLHIRHLQHLALTHLDLFIATFHIIIKYLTLPGSDARLSRYARKAPYQVPLQAHESPD